MTAKRTGLAAVLLVIALAGCARPPQPPFGRMIRYGTPGVESYGPTDQATTVHVLFDRCRAAAPTGTNPSPQSLAAACDRLRRTSRNQPCAWSRSC